MYKILVLLILILLCFAPLPLPAQKIAAEASPGAELPDIDGTWQMKPLLEKGTPAPDTGGTFQQFGETYVLDDFLVFWARFGEDEKAWGLFSLKNGKVVKILLENTDFLTPDGHKLRVTRHPTPSTSARLAQSKSMDAIMTQFWPVIHAGKRMLYISARRPEHVYGWDGERLLRVLGNGDNLTVGGAQYQIKRAVVLDVNTAGQALLYYDANKPEAEGWVLHDGGNFTPLWKEGDALPGRPEARIKNLSSGAGCVFKCVTPPRLLPDGSLLAFVELDGGKLRELLRISSDKSEPLPTGGGAPPRAVLIARPDSYVLDVTESSTKTSLLGTSLRTTYYEAPKLLFYQAGESRTVGALDIVHFVGKDDVLAFDEAVFLAPDSSRALVSMEIFSVRKPWSWGLKAKRITLSLPNLLFFDGQQLRRVAWETALGMDVGGVVTALEKSNNYSWSWSAAPDRILLRRVDGPVPGVRVELPPVGSGTTRWFVPASSTDGKLVQAPKFRVEGHIVTAADVLAWKGDVALVGLDNGYFLMERVPAK